MRIKKYFILVLAFIVVTISLSGCSLLNNDRRIIRIAHGQSATHPDHVGLLAFEKYVEDRLGDQYDIQIFPNELLGSSQKAIELVQTGALEFAIASTGNLETFNDIYQIFSIPYLFDSIDVFYDTMNDDILMNGIYESTEASGFQAVAWLTAGTRNFYATVPIEKPEDLKGKKIRVQQSPTNVRMMELFNAAAAPMSFGEVYTAIQQRVIDGAENNELALTNNKHGEVAKYYCYDQHQIVPDMLIANTKFLADLSTEERDIFNEAAKECTRVEVEEWDKQVEEAVAMAKDMGVEFFYPDIQPFKEMVLPLHLEILEDNPKLQPIYDRINNLAKQRAAANGGQ